MQILIQKLPKSQIELKIEVPTQDFQGFIEKAIANFGKDLEAPGFRKGHAPKEIIEREKGQGEILKEAAQLCLKEKYQEAILKEKIEPLGQPEVEILKLAPGNPFEFKVKIFIFPEINLADYKKIAPSVEKREVIVTEEEINRLKTEKERVEKERFRQEILEKIAESSEMEIPEVLIEAEKKQMLNNLKQEVSRLLQIDFKDYLNKINKTEEELLSSFSDEAQKRIKISLILKEIGKREKIMVSEEEIKKEMDKFLKNLSNVQEKFDPEELKSYNEETARNKKIIQLLESFSVKLNKEN